MGEHRPYKPGVTGSSPVPPTTLFYEWYGESYPQLNKTCGGVVQFWLERRPVTPEVEGSSPFVPAILNKACHYFKV